MFQTIVVLSDFIMQSICLSNGFLCSANIAYIFLWKFGNDHLCGSRNPQWIITGGIINELQEVSIMITIISDRYH